jgi:hypothetical protein
MWEDRLAVTCCSLAVCFCLTGSSGCILKAPTNQRAWTLEHAVMPTTRFDGDTVKIHNVRNFRHIDEKTMNAAYYNLELDLADVATVDLFSCYFRSDKSLLAHSMLSFGTHDRERFVLISVEGRREVGEEFNLVNATTRNLELIYVIADERDVIDQRAVVRDEKVYRYPIVARPSDARAMLVALLKDANELRTDPQFYRLLENNCTTNLVEHAGGAVGGKVNQAILNTFPGYADVTLRRIGLVDDSQPIMQQRALAEVNPLAQLYRDSADYSRRIRRE